MLLLYFDGLGFVVGFFIGYLGKRFNSISSKQRKYWVIGMVATVVVGWMAGILWHLLSGVVGGVDVYLDYGLAFFLLSLPGFAFGTFLDWVVAKWILKR